jgi:hypothetical protein
MGSITPDLQLLYSADTLMVNGTLAIDAQMVLTCADDDQLQETKDDFLADTQGTYGSTVSADTFVTANSSGMLQFDYHVEYANLIMGVTGLNTTAPSGYCVSCFPDVTIGKPTSTSFDVQPSVIFSLIPSFWVTGLDGSNIALTIQNTYSWTPAWAELPPYGVADQCLDATKPLQQSQGQIIANIVDPTGASGLEVPISGLGSDYHDCTGFTS